MPAKQLINITFRSLYLLCLSSLIPFAPALYIREPYLTFPSRFLVTKSNLQRRVAAFQVTANTAANINGLCL